MYPPPSFFLFVLHIIKNLAIKKEEKKFILPSSLLLPSTTPFPPT